MTKSTFTLRAFKLTMYAVDNGLSLQTTTIDMLTSYVSLVDFGVVHKSRKV